jgi:CheY-like chemotaxis protein
MDLKMQVMNGYEATQKIKDINPAIPVFAVTAFALEEDINIAKGVRFDGYIVKPIDRIELISKLRRI